MSSTKVFKMEISVWKRSGLLTLDLGITFTALNWFVALFVAFMTVP